MYPITHDVTQNDYSMGRKLERGEFITIRVSTKEKQKIAFRADEMGVSTSDYIRLRLCHEQPDLVQMANIKYHENMEKMLQSMESPYV